MNMTPPHPELSAAGFKPHRPRHKVGPMSQDLATVRKLNKYYKTQLDWWVSPSGEIVSREQALKTISAK